MFLWTAQVNILKKHWKYHDFIIIIIFFFLKRISKSRSKFFLITNDSNTLRQYIKAMGTYQKRAIVKIRCRKSVIMMKVTLSAFWDARGSLGLTLTRWERKNLSPHCKFLNFFFCYYDRQWSRKQPWWRECSTFEFWPKRSYRWAFTVLKFQKQAKVVEIFARKLSFCLSKSWTFDFLFLQ